MRTINRRTALGAIAAAFATPFVAKAADAAQPPSIGKKPPPPKDPHMPIDVILFQNTDNDPVLQLINPDGTCPDVTKITSAKLSVKAANYGAAVLPDKTTSSGIVFATDAGGSWVNATIHYSPSDMSSILGTLTQQQANCVGNLNITVTTGSGSQIATVPLRVQIFPSATVGG